MMIHKINPLSKLQLVVEKFRHLIKAPEVGNFTKCLKNQPGDVIKMTEMRGEVGMKTPKKEMNNPSFL